MAAEPGKSVRKRRSPPTGSEFPLGPKSISFDELSEEAWLELLHALDWRVHFYQQQVDGLERLTSPGLEKQINWYKECIAHLNSLRKTARRQIGFTEPLPRWP